MNIQVYDDTNALILTKELPEDGRKLTVGRHSDCDIRLAGDNSISRHHACFYRAGSGVCVESVTPANAVEVNHVRIQAPSAVNSGDKVQIGSFSLVVSGVDAASEAAPAGRGTTSAPASQPGKAESSKDISRDYQALAEQRFREEFGDFSVLYNEKTMKLIENIHEDVLRKMNWTPDAVKRMNSKDDRRKVEQNLDIVLNERGHEIPQNLSRDMLRQTMIDQIFGFGPLSRLLQSNDITEIMINGPSRIFVEYNVEKNKSICFQTEARFFNEQQLMSVIQKIVEPLGRRVDTSSPMVDARLPDGSRVNAIIPPLALQGPSVTIRKFSQTKRTTDDLIKFGSMTKEMALFLEEAVKARRNILVAGGTGSGKTTLLNILSQFIPEKERVITVEDSAELKLDHKNLVSLEARPANIEGEGRVTIRDLVINTLRMRPDRIIVGECRGPEALDMLQAMNTGHDGSLTTAHANTPRDALARMENMVMMAGFELPSKAIREQIASAIHLIVQQARMPDGSRKIIKITEITGCENDVVLMQDIFVFEQTGYNREERRVEGYFTATGNIPQFITERRESGVLGLDMSVFVPQN